jgi:hypothetical protein
MIDNEPSDNTVKENQNNVGGAEVEFYRDT